MSANILERAVEPNTNRAAYRREMMKLKMIAPPMRQCHRYELGPWSQVTGCNRHDIQLIEKQLKRLDRDLEILYDKSTVGGNSMLPGWHLYRRVRRAGVEAMDLLELVFSIQRKYDKPWPSGNPIHPDSTVLKEYQKRLYKHNHAEGDPLEASVREAKAYNEDAQAKIDKERGDKLTDLATEINNVGIKRGEHSDTMRRIRHDQTRKATMTKKTQVKV